MVKIFDLHCDTISKMEERGVDFTDESLHVNLDGLKTSQTVVQVFACFVLGNRPGKECFDACNNYVDSIEALISEYDTDLVQVTDGAGLEKLADDDEKTGIIISIEGAGPLMGDPEKMRHFYQRGVKILTVAWDDNPFCGSVFGNKSGLTGSGRKLIGICNELGVTVDVSHASDQAFYDIASVCKGVFIASHSNARAVCPNDRNLTDDMIRMIADRDGLVGLTYGSGFISPQYHKHEKIVRDKILSGLGDGSMTVSQARQYARSSLGHLPAAELPQLVEHAKHLLNTGGEQCPALGSDFDGVDSLVQGIDGAGSVFQLVREMEKQKIPSRVIEKICCENALDRFKSLL